MWLIKIFLILGLVNLSSIQTDKQITDVGIEIRIPYPKPLGEGEMIA